MLKLRYFMYLKSSQYVSFMYLKSVHGVKSVDPNSFMQIHVLPISEASACLSCRNADVRLVTLHFNITWCFRFDSGRFQLLSTTLSLQKYFWNI